MGDEAPTLSEPLPALQIEIRLPSWQRKTRCGSQRRRCPEASGGLTPTVRTTPGVNSWPVAIDLAPSGTAVR
ncbi:MAG: hypothetical protein QOE61_3467 [Micromonosporaceae bacterium]|jgi:hypothetical protein|nr:hypothetical protein [Micromonosporaceae bacterium]